MAGQVAAPEPVSPERATPARPVGAKPVAALLASGLVLGAIGAFLQAVTVDVGSLTVPVGLIVVLAALLAFIRALVHAYDRRLPAVWFFAGWAVASILLAIPWPGGDIVLGEEATAKVYLFGGAILASAAANVPAKLLPDDLRATGPTERGGT